MSKHTFEYGGYEVGSGGSISCSVCGKDVNHKSHVIEKTTVDQAWKDYGLEVAGPTVMSLAFKEVFAAGFAAGRKSK